MWGGLEEEPSAKVAHRTRSLCCRCNESETRRVGGPLRHQPRPLISALICGGGGGGIKLVVFYAAAAAAATAPREEPLSPSSQLCVPAFAHKECRVCVCVREGGGGMGGGGGVCPSFLPKVAH